MNSQYFRELKRHMHCSSRTKTKLLTKFQTQCQEGLEDNADYEAMVANFGPPEEFAQTLMEEVPAEELTRYRRNHVLLRAVLGLLAAVVLLFSLSRFASRESPTSPIDVEPGDTLYLGKYEQDNDLENGPEDIEWLVLERDGDLALIVSKYILDAGRHDDYEVRDDDWEGSVIRTWLNEDFLQSAFTPEEQQWIPRSTDRIFLLSLKETQTYLTDPEILITSATPYAMTNGANSNWWLRTVGYSQRHYCVVSHSGEIWNFPLSHQTFGIRPAIWVACSPTV